MTATEGRNTYYPLEHPIGAGLTDYEKYLRTVEILSLQKTPAEMVSPDELLFQVTHQTAELWMKQMMHELDRILHYLPEDRIDMAIRSFRLIGSIQKLLIYQVDQLGQNLSILEYGKIRTALGRGSGMESPGFNWLLAYGPRLWEAFEQVLSRRQLTIETIYTQYDTHTQLHTLAECLVDYDDLFHKWRTHHMDLVMRTIGIDSNSLKGIPTKVLQRGVLERFFPDLLELRNQLTNKSGLAYGGAPLEAH